MTLPPFEKLGAFYLGRRYDMEPGAITEDLILYDAKDLTTHAVCVGMTGSGKTGLCVSLLEEAAIDGIPAIAIDPKGDLGNLLLAFPQLRAKDFAPWIDPSEAARKGETPEAYARIVAARWREGLAGWGEDGERIARFCNAADRVIYTPGSSAGVPLSALRSFAPPPPSLLDDDDALRERVAASVSGLLTLLGIDADPIQSREHILLSRIFDGAWREGRPLDLATMIREIQSPPFERIGVFDLESFFSAKDPFALAMALNNLLASPGFAAWMEGEPLEIPRLLWTPEGKPRLSILSIAHLSDAERMFFVTLLLNEIVAWMRTQPGSGSLRALLYMDEVFGYFPPTANPPSKTPMLTLLKQARAFGLGVVLATQNPVDLDYKGLSNAGTWFLGRLQTERDKARVLDGLEGVAAASAGFDRRTVERTLSGLKGRVFLMHNVHDDAPAILHTRWAMSYLRGPLTRTQIKALTAARPAEPAPPATASAPAPRMAVGDAGADRPILPPGVREGFLPIRGGLTGRETLLYRPALLSTARIHFIRASSKVDHWEEQALLAPLPEDREIDDPWEEADALGADPPVLDEEPESRAQFAPLPAAAGKERRYKGWAKDLVDHLYRNRTITIYKSKKPKAISRPGESEAEFRVRIGQVAREERDRAVEALRKRYATKFASLRDRIVRAEERVQREQSQYRYQKTQTAISVGATILGALFGRKKLSAGTVGRATTAARGAGRARREKQDIKRARDNLEELHGRLADLEAEFERETEEIAEAFDPSLLPIDSQEIRPRKADSRATVPVLAWCPWRIGPDGLGEPAYR